jgi:phosphoglycerol transferase MdoB-like AlkP superfamily enzyme
LARGPRLFPADVYRKFYMSFPAVITRRPLNFDKDYLCYFLAVAGSFLVWLVPVFGGYQSVLVLQSIPLIAHAWLAGMLFTGKSGRIFYRVCVVAFFALIWLLNYVKIELMRMPLTWADVIVFGASPAASLREVKLPMWAHYGVLTAVPLVLLLAAGGVAWSFLRGKHLLIRTIAVLAFAISGTMLYRDFVVAADGVRNNKQLELWSPQGMAVISEQFGAVGFLAYSRYLGASETGPYFQTSKLVTPAAASDVHPSPGNLFVAPSADVKLPNIAVVLVESTFDPNRAFNLSKPFRSMFFDRHRLTHARGPLFVTPTGGGTWISEFEILTGMDSRLFGFHGRYTHTMLAPLVRRTLVTALREKGYATTAFYASRADFFNMGTAMHHYGFEKSYSSTALRLEKKDWKITDPAFVEAALKIARNNRDTKPQFNFFQFVENHSPHPCDEAGSARPVQITFAAPAGHDRNCQLQTYLTRAKSSERAVKKLMHHYDEIEARTGRPYVLVLFGDHQPHSFTTASTNFAKYGDFRKFRKSVDPRVTFFHILGTARKQINWPDGQMAPLYLLPTMASAYAASAGKGHYLPINGHAYAACGPNLLGTAANPPGETKFDQILPVSASGGRACAFVKQLVAAYKAIGMIDLR